MSAAPLTAVASSAKAYGPDVPSAAAAGVLACRPRVHGPGNHCGGPARGPEAHAQRGRRRDGHEHPPVPRPRTPALGTPALRAPPHHAPPLVVAPWRGPSCPVGHRDTPSIRGGAERERPPCHHLCSCNRFACFRESTRSRETQNPDREAAGVCSETVVGTHEPVGTESVASVHRSCSARSAWIWRYTRSPPMAASATRRSFFTARPRLSLT